MHLVFSPSNAWTIQGHFFHNRMAYHAERMHAVKHGAVQGVWDFIDGA